MTRMAGLVGPPWKSGFLRNIATVAGGTAAAQIVTVAFSPLITRLYGPEAFGLVGTFMAMVMLVGPLAGLAYAQAIVLPRSDAEARALLALSLLSGLVVTGLAAAAFGGWHRQIADAVGFTAASTWLLLAPVMTLLGAVSDPLQQWLVRKRQFRAISRVAMLQAVVTNTSKAAIGLVLAIAPVLLMLTVLGSAFNALLLWLAARRATIAGDDRSSAGAYGPAAVSLVDAATRYRDFPIYRAPQVWLNSASQSIPPLMLATLAGPAAVGAYAVARTVLALPGTLISGAVGTVFLPRLVEAGHRAERLRPLVLKGTAGLALVGLLPFGVVIATGPSLFGLVFGAEWIIAGEFARWLALWLFFGFINTPSVQAIPILGLQGPFLVYEIVSISSRAGALVLGQLVLGSALAAVALFSIVGALGNLFLIGWIAVSSGTRLRKSFGPETDA